MLFNIVKLLSISGHILAEFKIIAYSINALKRTINLYTSSLEGIYFINTNQLKLQSNFPVNPAIVKQILSIAYSVPDLNKVVRVYINNTNTNTTVACVKTELLNSKTIDQKGVK